MVCKDLGDCFRYNYTTKNTVVWWTCAEKAKPEKHKKKINKKLWIQCLKAEVSKMNLGIAGKMLSGEMSTNY